MNKADDTCTTFTGAVDYGPFNVKAVAIDASGGKWFGTYWVSCLNDNETPINKGDDTWTIYDYDDGLVGGVQAIAIDASGESGLGRTMG